MVKDVFNVSLGSLYSGKKQTIYLKLHFEKNLEGSEITLHSTVRGKGDGETLCEDKKTTSFKVIPSKEEEAIEKDQSLMERFALVDMADRANEALKRERAGDRVGASQMMNSSIRDHSANMPAGMINKYQHISSEMYTGMNEETRKRHHQGEYENKRGREMVRHYLLQLVNGHLIGSIEGKSVLIDTGVPVSVSDQAEWYFLHEVHQLPQEYMGVTLDYLSKMVGARVDILMGADILKTFHVTLDLFGRRINFSSRPLFISNNRIPMTIFMGVPSALFTIAGSEIQMFVDTGAKLSYVDHKIASQYTPIGKERDFYPGMGEFETSVFDIPFQLGQLNFNLRCGVLPPLLEKTLLVTGNNGIIGSELYQRYMVDLAFPENAIYLKEPA